jgi:hypothetical protein
VSPDPNRWGPGQQTGCSTQLQPWASQPPNCIRNAASLNSDICTVHSTRDSWWRAGAAALSLQATACGYATEVNYSSAGASHCLASGTWYPGRRRLSRMWRASAKCKSAGSIASAPLPLGASPRPPRHAYPERPRPGIIWRLEATLVFRPFTVLLCRDSLRRILYESSAVRTATSSMAPGASRSIASSTQNSRFWPLALPMKDEFPPPLDPEESGMQTR